MARCRLGERKCRRIERLTGLRVIAASVRGGWEHYVAEVRFHDGRWADVNYKTGTVEWLPPSMRHPTPWWRPGAEHFIGEGI
jgi:hypothetical protein